MFEIISKLRANREPGFFTAGLCFTAFVTAFLFVNSLMFIEKDFTTLTNYIRNFNVVYFVTNIIIITFWLLAVSRIFLKGEIINIALLVSVIVFSVVLVAKIGSNIYFDIGISILICVIVRWLTADNKLGLDTVSIPWYAVFAATFFLFLLLTFCISYFTILRYRSYGSATFDFGIFAQMFENMRQTGLPNTTVERTIAMSHFGIHFSPTFYLLLPGYFLFPRPEYLLVSQAFCVYLGVFAIYGICKRLGFSPKTTLAFVVIYAFYPSLSSGCFYDFHENKFLTVLILYMIYFIAAGRTIPVFIIALLTLGIKEDAAIYVAAVALYLIIAKKKYLSGIVMFMMTVVYFMAAGAVVKSLGEGVMMWRLSDYFIGNDVSFASVIKACFYDIGYLFKNVFTAQKLEFIFWMLLPVVFTPLLSENLGTLFLLVPMLVINLMPSWRYQYDVDYQYTYGVAALIMAAAIFNVAGMKSRHKRFILLSSMIIAIVMCTSLVYPKIKSYKELYEGVRVDAAEVTTEIDNLRYNKFAENASVTVSQYLMPHLYFRYKNLYTLPIQVQQLKKTDYFLVDIRDQYAEGYDCKPFIEENYDLVAEAGFMQVYKLKSE